MRTPPEAEHQERDHAVTCVVCQRPRTAWRHDAVCPDCIARASHVAPGTVIAVAKPTAAHRAFNRAQPDCESCGGLGRINGRDCTFCREARWGR